LGLLVGDTEQTVRWVSELIEEKLLGRRQGGRV